MKTNSIWMMTAAMAAMLCGTALAQGNGNNQPTGQAGAGGATSVVVTNGSAQPVPVSTTQTLPVKEMNDIGHQPFAFRWNYSFVSGNPLMTVSAPGVPAGKRLVIDYVSGSASGITTGTEMVITIGGTCNGVYPIVYVPTTLLKAYLFASAPAKLCVDAGSMLSVGVDRTEDNNGLLPAGVAGNVTVIGHFVDLP